MSSPNTRRAVLLPAPPVDARADTARIRLDSPVGRLEVEATGEAIIAMHWIDDEVGAMEAGRPALLVEARRQLEAYFDRRLTVFDLPLAPAGSPFERDVWRLMCDIPQGATMTYGEMANALGGVARAVGCACGANPIPVIIPCHRVLG